MKIFPTALFSVSTGKRSSLFEENPLLSFSINKKIIYNLFDNSNHNLKHLI